VQHEVVGYVQIQPFYDESLNLGGSRAIEAERQDVCFRGPDSRYSYCLHVRASSFHAGDVCWVIDSTLSYHYDPGAIRIVDILYTQSVHAHARSVSILCVSVCAHPDLPRHSVHKHTRYRIAVGTRYAVASGLVPHSCCSMLGGRSLRDEGQSQAIDQLVLHLCLLGDPRPKPLNDRGQALFHTCSDDESRFVPDLSHVSAVLAMHGSAEAVILEPPDLSVCLLHAANALVYDSVKFAVFNRLNDVIVA